MVQNKKLKEAIAQFSRLIAILEDQVLDQPEFKNITLRQFFYLDIIRNLDDPTITKITEHLNITKPTATIAINKLEAQGFIKKLQSKTDGRIYHINLTTKGKKINEAHDRSHEMIVKSLVAALSDKDILELTRLLNQILYSFNANDNSRL
jgi:DNA-binding MarR family transcriptional regulator